MGGGKVQLAFIKWNLNFLIGAESAVGMDSLSSGNQNTFTRQIEKSLLHSQFPKLCHWVLPPPLWLGYKIQRSERSAKDDGKAWTKGKCKSHFPLLCFTAKKIQTYVHDDIETL